MPAVYKIDRERRFVLTTGSGSFNLLDALAHQEALLRDPEFDPTFSQLMDLTQVTSFDISSADAHSLAQRTIFAPDSRRAILVNSDLGFGLSRMFEMLRDNLGEEGIRVFRNREEASAWVLPLEKSS